MGLRRASGDDQVWKDDDDDDDGTESAHDAIYLQFDHVLLRICNFTRPEFRNTELCKQSASILYYTECILYNTNTECIYSYLSLLGEIGWRSGRIWSLQDQGSLDSNVAICVFLCPMLTDYVRTLGACEVAWRGKKNPGEQQSTSSLPFCLGQSHQTAPFRILPPQDTWMCLSKPTVASEMDTAPEDLLNEGRFAPLIHYT